jgi:hypothetical protein
MVGWLAAIVPVLLVATGLGTYFLMPCRFRDYCEFSEHTYILSNDKEKRDTTKRALRIAKERFENLFVYQPVIGSLLLDRGIVEPLPIKIQSEWRLRYDPSGPVRLSDVLADIGEAKGTDLYLVEGKDIDMAGDGVAGTRSGERLESTTHEICHAYLSNSMQGRPYSDAVDEIAAISCESDQAINIRVEEFKTRFRKDGIMPWDRFLQLRHPLKAEFRLAKLLGDAVDHAQASLAFSIDSKTDLGREVDLFYSQSAIFVSVWQSLCPKSNALADMAMKLSPKLRFSDWISSNGLQCSPDSLEEFNEAVSRRLAIH